MFETLVANLDYSRRVEERTENGRKYLVASAVILKEGILPGNHGPLLYPGEEIAKSPGSWNSIPVTNGHPKKNGQYVLFNEAGIDSLGFLRNDQVDGKKRRVKVWFDIERWNKEDSRVIPAVRAGQRVGLSTGLRTRNHWVQPGTTWNGKQYVGIARDYKPDHLAILVDVPGACSLNDGCGINVNSAPQALIANQRQNFFQNLSSFLSSIPPELMTNGPADSDEIHAGEEDVEANCDCESCQKGEACECGATANEEMSLQRKLERINRAFREAHPMKYDPDTGASLGGRYLQDVYEDYIVYREDGKLYWQSYETSPSGVISFKPDVEEVEQYLTYEPVSGETVNAASDSVSAAKACKILKDGMVHGKPLTKKQRGMFGAACGRMANEDYDAFDRELIAVNLSDHPISDWADEDDEEPTDNSNPSTDQSSNPDPLDPSFLETSMFKLTEQVKKQIKDELTANQNTSIGVAWKSLNLDQLSDDALVAYHKMLKTQSQEIGTVHPDGSRTTYNQKTGQFEFVPAPQQTQQQQQPTPTVNCGTQTQQQQQQQEPTLPPHIAANLGNGSKPQSMAEYLEKNGTPEEKAAWNAVMNAHKEQKDAILTQILQHVQGDQERIAAYNIYKDFSIPQLQVVLSTIPKPQPTANQGAGFFGLMPFNPGATSGQTAPSTVKPLRAPTYNYGRQTEVTSKN